MNEEHISIVGRKEGKYNIQHFIFEKARNIMGLVNEISDGLW